MGKIPRRIPDLGAFFVVGQAIRPSWRNRDVWQVVMMRQRGFVRRNFDEEDVYVGVLENQVVMAFLAHGNGRR